MVTASLQRIRTQPKSSVAEYVNYDQWVTARLEADPKTLVHAPLLDAPHAALMVLVKARNDADNLVLKASAKRDFARDTLHDSLEPLSLKTAAHFNSKKAAGYVRIFVLTPSQYANLPKVDQPKAFDDLKLALNNAETPKEVLKHAAEYLAALASLVAADKVVEQAQAALTKSVKTVDQGKITCLEGSAKLRSALQGQFPRQPKIVARYFPPVQPKKKDKVVVVAPVPGPNPE